MMRPLVASSPRRNGYLRADAGRLVDGRGEQVLLRGVGLGNWMLPEGYMWRFEEPGPQSPRQMESFVADLVGPDRAAKFWHEFRRRYVTEDDIAKIAAEGMNHVRLPINSRAVIADDGTPVDEGLALIDRLVGWCRAHDLWVVLDLHGAPGGQTGTNIDDSPNGMPELFMSSHYQRLTVTLWRMLAQRYAEEPVVAGYDLLNEPLPNEYQHVYAAELVAIYRELTAAIREVDRNHLIIYEGTHWATNWSIFTDVWDSNSMLQFHRYWAPPDRPGIKRFLDARARLGLPIYMGEGGENNLDWLQTAFQLYEDHDISWNFWPWKKMETLTSPCSVDAPVDWAGIVACAAGKGDKPDAAWHTLLGFLNNVDLAHCTYRPEVVAAILRRVPLRLPASGFGFRGTGESYHTSTASPLPGFRSDDRVTILWDGPPGAEPDFHHTDGSARARGDELLVSLDAGEWVAYEITVDEPAALSIRVRLRNTVAPVSVSIDGEAVASTTTVQSGRHTVRVTSNAPRTQLAWLEIT